MDGCRGWDTWGHEAAVDEVGTWHVIGEYGGGVTAEYGIEGGVDVHEWSWGGKRGVVRVQVDTRGCCWHSIWWWADKGRVDGSDPVLWNVRGVVCRAVHVWFDGSGCSGKEASGDGGSRVT